MIGKSTLTKAISKFAGAGMLTLASLFCGQASAQEIPQEILDAAAEEGAFYWMDIYGYDQAEAVLSAFQEQYPFIRDIQYVQVSGTQKHSRTLQECVTGLGTVDIYKGNGANVNELSELGHTIEVDWAELGIGDDLVVNPYMVRFDTVVYVIMYNMNNVSPEEAPKDWEDMLDPKWKGRTGKYARAGEIGNMGAVWGEEKALEYARAYAELEPRLYAATFALAQAVASGEIDVAFGVYDTITMVQSQGGPLEIVPLDPTPLSPQYASILNCAEHPNAAKLFLAWVSSPEGALLFEQFTQRGSAFVPGTRIGDFLEGRNLAYWSVEHETENAAQYRAFQNGIEEIVRGQ